MAKSARKFLLCLLLVFVDADVCGQTKKKPSTPAPVTQVAKATPVPVNVPVLAEGELPLKARGAIVIDALTGIPLYEKNSDLALFPASTTKIMTALLVIEAGDLDAIVEADAHDSRVGESGVGLKLGERYSRREMLYALMLKSANDVAHCLARDNAGSMDAFAEKMTQRARELGATNTRFRNPHGLHHIEHYTSSRDLALVTRAAMQQPFFRRIVATQSHRWESPLKPWDMANHNRLLREFPGCTGVKTGFTNPAQHTLVTAALRDNREVIAVVLYDGRSEKWEDSKLLLNYGFDNPPGSPGAGRKFPDPAAAAR